MGKNKHAGKFTLKQFAWNGFNLTVGINFLGSLAILSNQKTSGGSELGLGFNILWIFAIMGIIAGSCAFAFSRLSRIHKQDANGGSYIFARAAFGRFLGFLTIFLNYILTPLVMSNQILMFVKANLDPTMATGHADSTFWLVGWTRHLGNWSSLFYDLLGIGLAAVFVLIAFFGTRMFKKVMRGGMFLKWATALFFILFGIIAAILPATDNGNLHHWANVTTSKGGLTFSHFLSAFCACFYYFTGFEMFASSGATVQEPEKNISKGILFVMVSSCVFYIVTTFIFMMAVSEFDQNIVTGFWLRIYEAEPWLRWLLYAGPLIMLVNTICSRGVSCSMLCLYGGTTLQPMSQEGYISDKFGKQNSHGFPIGAMKVHVVIIAITIGVWEIIPDIITGFTGASFINVNTIISAASVFFMLIYIFILLSALKFAFKKILFITWLEWFLYFAALFTMILVTVFHYKDLIDNLITTKHDYLETLKVEDKHKYINAIVSLGVELFFIVGCILFVVIVYFTYYAKKYKSRLQKNPNIQKKLNTEFRLLSGWSFFGRAIGLKITNFLIKRTQKVNKSYSNAEDKKFIAKYKKESNSFMKKIDQNIKNYLQALDNANAYNKQHGLDTNNDFSVAKNKTNQLMRHINHHILQPPKDYRLQDITDIHQVVA